MLENLEKLLAFLGGPITLAAEKDKTVVRIDYKFIADPDEEEG